MKKTLSLMIVLLAASGARGASAARTILVFPFANQSARADLNWISESFAVLLSSRLAAPNRYVLGQEERKAAYEQLGLPPETPLTLASEYLVAQTLGVDWAVVGRFAVVGDRLTVRAQFLDARVLKLFPPIAATGQLAELADLQTQLAWRLLASHAPDFTVGKEEDFQRLFPEVHLDAFENYIRGIQETNGESRVRFLTEADRRNPSDHAAAFELGLYYFDQKDYAKAAPWLRKLNEQDEDYLESLFLLGVGEFFMGHQGAAERAFASLAKEIPLSEVANNLGVMESRQRDYASALAEFERARQGDPDDSDFSFNVAASLWYLQRYDEAAKILEKSLQGDDEDPEAHTLLAALFNRLGDSTGKQRELHWISDHEGSADRSEDLPSDFAPATRLKKNYDGRAFRLLSLAVRNALEQKLAALPPALHEQAHLLNGKKLLAAGRFAEAERELAEAILLQPEDSDAHLVLGEVYEGEARHLDAAAELERSLKLKNTAAAHLWLGRAYLALNKVQAARDEGQAALGLDPGNQEAEHLIENARGAERPPAARRVP